MVAPRAYAPAMTVEQAEQGGRDPARGPARVVPYGRPATDALREAVRAAQAADPLAPVTVVVPSNVAGLTARRQLGEQGGLANVAFLTPFALAERLGRARAASAGRLPLTEPVLLAAIRVELRAAPGSFRPVAGHVATERAIARRYAELSRVEESTWERLRREGSPRARELVELSARVRSRLWGYSGEETLASHALAAVEAGDPVLDSLGTVLVYLPQPIPPALARVVRGAGARRPGGVIVGLTGDASADASVLQASEALGVTVTGSVGEVVTGTEIVTASDVDEEVRSVVRRRARARRNRDPARSHGDPRAPDRAVRARTVDAQLGCRGNRAQRRVGRACWWTPWPAGRSTVWSPSSAPGSPGTSWWTCSPARPSAPPTAGRFRSNGGTGSPGGPGWWTARTGRSGSSATRPSWTSRRTTGLGPAWVGTSRCGGRRTATRALAEFVADLARRLADLEEATGWASRAEQARLAVMDLLGEPAPGWPDEERDAWHAVLAVLDGCAALDAVEPDPSFATFAAAVGVELRAPVGRSGTFGDGVLCTSIAAGLGLDLDAVFAVGLAEGQYPVVRREDALLADADRTLAPAGELGTRESALADQRRALLAALAAGAEHRVLSFPAAICARPASGSHRGSCSTPRPTRTGSRVFASDFRALGAAASVDAVASFSAGLARAESPSPVERELGDLATFVDAGGDVLAHPAAASTGIGRGVEATRARASAALTRWDGNVSAVADLVPSPATGDIVSATRLEDWSSCPFRYFLATVLRVPVEETPERLLELSPLDRGTLVHEVLERFVREELDRPPADRVPVGAPWPSTAVTRMRELVDEAAAAAEARGLTGKAVLWELHRDEIETDLVQFLLADSECRTQTRAVPERVEFAFGFDDVPPVTIETPGGSVVRFRGRADRIDRRPDGTLVVLDYKTGRPGQPPEGCEDDPVWAGDRLQLPVYAEAARQHLGADSVESAYWYVSQRGGFGRDAVALDEETSERFRAVVGQIVEGIDGGIFPAAPGEPSWLHNTEANCAYCPFDDLCPVDRGAQYDAKIDAPELEHFHGLMPEVVE